MTQQRIIWFDKLGIDDVPIVGGKNASLGELLNNLTQSGVQVPNGFATTADAYREFLTDNDLVDSINQLLNETDVDNLSQLTKNGAIIRRWILEANLSPILEQQVTEAWQILANGQSDLTVAVRSSATAEDLPDASFAGQQETFLNVRTIEAVLQRIKQVFASLFTDRAIAYRVHQGFDHSQVALSVGVQKMVRSDKAASGVMFTLDTESGFRDVVLITAAYGLGELVVQGAINPDEFYVYKPGIEQGKLAILSRTLGRKQQRMIYNHDEQVSETVVIENVDRSAQLQFSITDEDITELAKQAILIEKHYGRPMDIEWAKDGCDGKIYIVQARPETVKSQQQGQSIERYQLQEQGNICVSGRSIGQRIGQGTAKVVKDISQIDRIEKGDVLVTDMTDPDWEPVMKKAAAIVTNRGGRTCHAAIIARELGIPAVVGCSEATTKIEDGYPVTVSCAQGDVGYVYHGLLKFTIQQINISTMPSLPFKISMNIGTPDRAFDFQRLPNAGIGLARLEFIINRNIGIHPKALLNPAIVPEAVQQLIEEKTGCYSSPVDFYIDRLAEGISTLAAAFAPKPVIVRMSDFKSNEYANLIGGEQFEPSEENPMLGFRGASRYIADEFRDCFLLECEAIKKVRNQMGLTNVEIMIPFVRTVEEAKDVISLLADHGLKRGENGLRIIMMCEIPSNALLAEQFLAYFDGFSIGSNDLTQLTLGLDRDSGLVAQQFDERDDAVKLLLHMAIQACRKADKYIGICGQGPSDHADLAKWLMEQGISAISLNPDTVVATWMLLAET